MDIISAKKLLRHMFNLPHIPCELVSKPGVGKTAVVHQVVKEIEEELGEPIGLVTHHLATYDSVDINGYMIPKQDKDTGEMLSVFTRPPIMPFGKDLPARGVVFLDEYGQAEPDVKKPVARFLNEGRIGDYQLPPGWVKWMASNRVEDNSGVGAELAFMRSRMMRIEIDPQLSPFVKWAEENQVHPLVIAFARTRPELIFTGSIDTAKGEEGFCTPRTLVYASDVLQEFDDLDIATEAVSGLIGPGAAVELMAFMKVVSRIPTFDQVVASPKTALLPTEPDALFAVTQMCSFQVTGDTAKQCFDYFSRLPQEYQIVGIRSAMNKSTRIVNHPDFQKWIVANQDLVIAATGVGAY